MFDRLDRQMDEILSKEVADLKRSVVFKNKADRKKQLFEQIALSESTLVDRIRALAKEVVLSSMAKFMIKENLGIKLGFFNEKRSGFAWSAFFRTFFKRSLAVSLAAFTFLFVVFQPWTNTFTVSADAKTYLSSYSGNVAVLRAGDELDVSEGLLLKDNDQVIVGLDSSAEVRLFTNNVVRLKENSHIVLSQIAIRDNSRLISLNLLEGELWASVFETLGNFSQFKVRSGDITVLTSDPSRFSLRRNSESTHVIAIDDDLDIILEHNKQLITHKLGAEQIVRVRAARPYISYQQRLNFLDAANDLDFSWYEKNLVADRLFQEELKNDVINMIASNVGLEPESSFYSLKELSRKADVALTFNPASKQKKKLENAQEKFFEAQYLLNKGGEENTATVEEKADTVIRAKELLAEYQTEVVEVVENLPRLAYLNPEAAEDVERKLDADFSEQRTTLNVLKDEDELLFVRVVQVETERVAGIKITTDSFSASETEQYQINGLADASDLDELDEGFLIKDEESVELYEITVKEEVADESEIVLGDQLEVFVEELDELKEVKIKIGEVVLTSVDEFEVLESLPSIEIDLSSGFELN